jgi:outer membrane protein assembly factor BamB
MTPKSFMRSAVPILALSIMLSGCSTLGKINPFNKGEQQVDQGDIPENSDRLTILSLGEKLTLGSAVTPADVKLPAPYVNTQWPQPGGNQYHAMQHMAASGPLTKAWSVDIGKGSSAKGRVVAQPVIANGVIYAMDGRNLITAMNETDGSKLWTLRVTVENKGKTRKGKAGVVERVKRPFNLFGDKGGNDVEAIGGGLSYDSGRLFVSSGYGVMIALDAQNGAEIWRTKTRTPLHSAPTISGGRVYAGTDDNEIFAFDADKGEVLWTYQAIIESARMLTSPSVAVVDDVVIAPFASGELMALRAQNGGVLWQDALSSSGKLTPLSSLNDIAAGPVIADGYVFATAQSGVISAFDLRTGTRVWSQPAGALGYPAVGGEFIYVVTTDGSVVCMSRGDGSVVWMTQLAVYENAKKKKHRIAWTGPVLAGDRIIVAGSNGQAVTLNPYNGTVQRSFKIGGSVFIPPIVANETVYMLTDKAKLVALK